MRQKTKMNDLVMEEEANTSIVRCGQSGRAYCGPILMLLQLLLSLVTSTAQKGRGAVAS